MSDTAQHLPSLLAGFRRIVESADRVDDDWFRSGAFKTWKNPMPVSYELAMEPGTVDTLEGPMRYAAGHYIMTGPKGERYPISAEKFASLYDDNGNGTATPKRVEKWAKVADHDGVLHTSWGDLAYTTGDDYIVRHGPNDYGAVKADIFAKTYHQPGGPQDTLAEDTAAGHWALLNDILDEEDFLADEMEAYLDAVYEGRYAEALDFLNGYLAQSQEEGAWFGDLRALEIKPNPADEDEPYVRFNRDPRGDHRDAMIKTILTDIKHGNMGLAASRYLLMRLNGETGPELDAIGKSLAASGLLG